MIVSRDEMPTRPIEIDLSGPDGNAYVLMAYARDIGRRIGYSEEKIKAIHKVMMMSNYEGLVHTFNDQFNEYVIIYR